MIPGPRIDRKRRSTTPPTVAAELFKIEVLESRTLLSAIRPGFDANTLARSDDESSSQVDLGFSLNFFGPTYHSLFVNTNGNVTFGAKLRTYIPFGLITKTGTPIIAPFFADIDTRPPSSGTVNYGSETVDGQLAFGVTWRNVGYFNSKTDKLNTFQLVLIDRSETGTGNFDIEFNYDQVQWESGDLSTISDNGLGGESARVGFSNGSGSDGTKFELTGSGVNGAFLDANLTTGLSNNSLNSTIRGRYLFSSRQGILTDNHAPVLDFHGNKTVRENSTLHFPVTATDLDQDSLTYSLVDAPAGASIDPTTGVFSWTPNVSQGPGDYAIRVQVTDNGTPNLSDFERFLVTVLPNQVPVAQDQTVNAIEDQPVTGTLSALDPEGDAITFQIVANPTKGSVLLLDPVTGAFRYTPAPNAFGVDTFRYRVNDGRTDSQIRTVTIEVAEDNDAPTAQPASYDTPGGTALWVAAPSHLMFDRDGDSLTAALTAEPSHGTLEWNADGSFRYTPATDFNGVDTFQYRVSDGRTWSDSAMVTVRVGGRDGDTVAPHLVDVQRFGFHRRPTRLALVFDKDLDLSRAEDLANYQVTNAGRDGRLGTRDDVDVALVSASYDSGSRTVLLRPDQRLYLYGRHEVRIGTAGPRAPVDLAGNFLARDADSQSGADIRARFGREALTRPADRTAVRTRIRPRFSPRNLVASAQTVRRQPWARGPAAIS